MLWFYISYTAYSHSSDFTVKHFLNECTCRHRMLLSTLAHTSISPNYTAHQKLSPVCATDYWLFEDNQAVKNLEFRSVQCHYFSSSYRPKWLSTSTHIECHMLIDSRCTARSKSITSTCRKSQLTSNRFRFDSTNAQHPCYVQTLLV